MPEVLRNGAKKTDSAGGPRCCLSIKRNAETFSQSAQHVTSSCSSMKNFCIVPLNSTSNSSGSASNMLPQLFVLARSYHSCFASNKLSHLLLEQQDTTSGMPARSYHICVTATTYHSCCCTSNKLSQLLCQQQATVKELG
jgi:hypothetical protein